MAAAWNEKLSNELKNLNTVKTPTAKQKARIAELKSIKSGKSNAPASPTPPPTAPNPPAASDTPLTGVLPGPGKLSPTDEEILTRVKGILGVGEQFGRKIANEFYADGSLGRQVEAVTAEEQASLDAAKQFAARAGIQSDQVKNLIGQQQGILSQAQTLSPLELEALGVARSGLEGLDAQSMEALRSSARANIQGSMQSGMRELAKNQARGQVFGSAATAQQNALQGAGVRETRNLERDLLVKNIDIKQAAQNAFTGLVTNTEAAKAGRTNAASGQLSSTILNDEGQRSSAQNNANANYGNIAANVGSSLRNIQQFNLGQSAAEKAGKVSSILGGLGTVTDQRGLLAGEKFTEDQYKLSQEKMDEILKMLEKSFRSSGF